MSYLDRQRELEAYSDADLFLTAIVRMLTFRPTRQLLSRLDSMIHDTDQGDEIYKALIHMRQLVADELAAEEAKKAARTETKENTEA